MDVDMKSRYLLDSSLPPSLSLNLTSPPASPPYLLHPITRGNQPLTDMKLEEREGRDQRKEGEYRDGREREGSMETGETHYNYLISSRKGEGRRGRGRGKGRSSLVQ